MFASDEKKELVGPIMIPNKEILRYDEKVGYYYVRFTEETIKEIMYKYSKEGLFNAFGINHSYDTDEVVMLEVWMKEGEYDKSMNYGFDLPNGTVFVKAKVESDELFTSIKDGEINGFSIEIKADIKQIYKEEEEMNEFSFGKELGKLEAQFESNANKYEARSEALENENNVLLEAVSSFEDKFAGIDELKNAIEMIQKHIESMEAPVEEEVVEEVMEEKQPEEEVIAEEPVAEEEVVENKVEEKYSAEEETNELEVEEQFAAEQKAEEVEETVEDKTVVFSNITSEKVDMINNFFNRK